MNSQATASPLTCFKAYDIRGQLGTQINEDIAYRIGRAFAIHLKAKTVVVGGDARETSEPLKMALAQGLQDEGCDVVDIGMVGTEEIYFATSYLKVDGGIIVTASHNPIDYNGMKLVRENSKPISGDTGLFDIQYLAESQPWLESESAIKRDQEKGTYTLVSNLEPYADHLLTYVKADNFKPLKLVVNSGNGAAGHVIDELEQGLKQLKVPITFIKVHHQPDHTFPNGIPNPLLPENREDTRRAVLEHKADMGIAWDGDFDRCFLFDENGEFIEGYYIVGLLAEAFLKKNPGEKVIYDPRVYWNTVDIIESNGGVPIMSKTGHAFIKERMRQEDAVYGGEMSAHHYFRDFNYCDSGMIPWLLVAELVCTKQQALSQMVKNRISKYPSSGEINFKVSSVVDMLAKIKNHTWENLLEIREIDGIDMIFKDWRFNLRGSNTEPFIRLNIESKQNDINEKINKLNKLVLC
ncbi:phosphomannomutase CpsG [Shewanella sp. VB17]|uniref:phosphomannomutase CpsG n=1 Tax=Shewanella sp. VB17 TaxID=2739432 RepID=UPI0015673DC5|nr:phosphomannomutase CpsG [Shewanella sp. VB17]NRD72378.1 phosphomannomutase CpsG [Shewanella sp. VB17]